MKSPSYILAIDQGTTGTRAILYHSSGRSVAANHREFRQYYPRPGWVEHDPVQIWESVLEVIAGALQEARVRPSQIKAIGITNQRETTVLWDKRTGKPVSRAIVWQDRRTAADCLRLKKKGYEKMFRARTGLVLDPYFSGTKIKWLLDHVRGLKQRAKQGKILFGTIDTWLLWKLTGGKVHATDFTNASRTLLLNIKTRQWDPELLKALEIPEAILPAVCNSGSYFGETVSAGPLVKGIPILAMLGDQQAALFGQGCYRPGGVKNTYGTGCFLMANIGKKYKQPPFGLLATLACDEEGRPVYAFEGAIFVAGAAVQWLRDGVGFFKKASETDALARRVRDTAGVVFIPALTGLGSPYWNPNVRGVITGLTRGTKREHIVRATLESIAHQSADVLESMRREHRLPVRELKVDGGATQNRFLMQFQSDILGIPILVSDLAESTAWGAAKLAGKAAGLWPSLRAIDRKRRYRRFGPRMGRSEVTGHRSRWKKEIRHLLG